MIRSVGWASFSRNRTSIEIIVGVRVAAAVAVYYIAWCSFSRYKCISNTKLSMMIILHFRSYQHSNRVIMAGIILMSFSSVNPYEKEHFIYFYDSFLSIIRQQPPTTWTCDDWLGFRETRRIKQACRLKSSAIWTQRATMLDGDDDDSLLPALYPFYTIVRRRVLVLKLCYSHHRPLSSALTRWQRLERWWLWWKLFKVI